MEVAAGCVLATVAPDDSPEACREAGGCQAGQSEIEHAAGAGGEAYTGGDAQIRRQAERAFWQGEPAQQAQ